MADEKKETGPVEHRAVTGRPIDVAPENTTFAARAKARRGSKRVASDEVEDKAVKAASSKSVAKQASK